ncbi:phosphatidylserine decarboxylase family protein [Alistipes sp. OttesenSCG-928-B03]|nr:phosphatidylserine decarboxylase family protein [Alistipes sp. OttesenSCG-928-B03]
MKINKEGYKIIAVTTVTLAVICTACFIWLPTVWAYAVGVLAVLVVAFELMFFRYPRRPRLTDDGIVYSPADGKVVVIETVTEKEYLGDERIQVSVFMSLTNVHANWYPVGGEVVYARHHHGKFMVAWHPKSSEENERTTTVVDTGRHKILFRQIAGLVARRIVCYAREGEQVGQNTPLGFIKFGSRVDIMLPAGSEILVQRDQKVTGSQTPIARLP